MDVKVTCAATAGGHRCEVDITDAASSSHHTVSVSAADLRRWGRGRAAEDLVRGSFAFLLQREPPGSILREFDLSVIGRYFPEYEATISSVPETD